MTDRKKACVELARNTDVRGRVSMACPPVVRAAPAQTSSLRRVIATIAITVTLLIGWVDTAIAAPAAGVTPTLIEPVVPPSRPPGWYADGITNSTAMQINFGSGILLKDLQVLQSPGNEAVLRVLETSAMAYPTDLALLAHLAGISALKDPESLATLRELEAQGHALAAATRARPDDLGWIQKNLRSRRILLNQLGGKAARGDAAALQELTQLSTKLQQLPLFEKLGPALRALVLAQHQMRVRQAAGNGANDAFYILRRFSFEDALQYVADVGAFRNLPLDYWRSVFGAGPGVGGRPPASAKRDGCFVIDRVAWDAAELDVYDVACVPGSKAAAEAVANPPWQDQACASDAARQQMDVLLRQAVRAPNIQAKLEEVSRVFKVRIAMPPKVESSRAYQYNEGEQWAICEAFLQEDHSETRGQLPVQAGPFTNALVLPWTKAAFRSEVGPNGVRTLRVLQVMETVPAGAPTAETRPAPAVPSRKAAQEPPVRQQGAGSGPIVTPQLNADIDAKFKRWAQTWRRDRYVSSQADAVQCEGGACKATGHMEFVRGGMQFSIPFAARVEPTGGNNLSLGLLCYSDTTTGSSDCYP